MKNENVKAVLVLNESVQLSDPKQILKLADTLANFIKDRKLSVNIKNKNYCLVDGWEFAGAMMGIVPIIQSIEKVPGENAEIKYQSVVHLVRLADDKLVGKGVALCSNKEASKKMFDEYAIQSMAQTRSIGKAYRNMLGWLMKAAGYESTPAEEMPREQKAEMPSKTPEALTNKQSEGNLDVAIGRINELKTSKEVEEESRAIRKDAISWGLTIKHDKYLQEYITKLFNNFKQKENGKNKGNADTAK